MAHKIYDNFYLSNEIEDQYNSHLDLQSFCTVDNTLEGTAGMLRKINVYKATDGTESWLWALATPKASKSAILRMNTAFSLHRTVSSTTTSRP